MPRWAVLARCGCIVLGYDGDDVDAICDDIWDSDIFLDRHGILCPLHGRALPTATVRLGSGACIVPVGYDR